MKRTTILLLIVVAAAFALGMRTEAFGPVDPYFWPNTHAYWYGGRGGQAMQPRIGLQHRADPYF
jgi:hypothetical protein